MSRILGVVCASTSYMCSILSDDEYAYGPFKEDYQNYKEILSEDNLNLVFWPFSFIVVTFMTCLSFIFIIIKATKRGVVAITKAWIKLVKYCAAE